MLAPFKCQGQTRRAVLEHGIPRVGQSASLYDEYTARRDAVIRHARRSQAGIVQNLRDHGYSRRSRYSEGGELKCYSAAGVRDNHDFRDLPAIADCHEHIPGDEQIGRDRRPASPPRITDPIGFRQTVEISGPNNAVIA
jgi:hypothetical protein